MERKRKFFYFLLVISTLLIVCLVTVFFVKQLNNTISDNIISSISEIAVHDKSTIETHIETCWKDLREINERFISYECDTIQDVEIRMNLECASSSFTHIYLVSEDGTVYTDKYITYMPDEGTLNLMPYFSGGNEHVVARFDDKIQGSRITNESILYGIRLKDYSVDGIKMYALIGISDVSTMQDNIVIDSFIKNGKSRGHSSLIDLNGNYIVNVNKDIHLNWQRNLFDHLSESADSELTNEEVFRKLHNSETFAFYHTHVGEKNKELFYFIPFNKDIDLYFIMSVNEEVFMEQSHTFVTMSMATLIISMIAVVIMLLVVMKFQVQAARTSAKARAQKEFLSNMSHEIRTPLNGLIGMNHLIMVNIDDDQQKSQIKEWLKKSHSTASYLLSLVNDILDMSKLQAGKVDIINEPLMVDVLVEEIVTMQAENIRSRGVDFIVEKDITEPCILGDATRIKQILMNIVGNAAKFTPKGNYIKLSVSQKKIDAQHVITTYCCEDTGIGISKEYIGKIFDSFTQERNRFENNVKGTGLGMAISKLLANAMNGDIAVESEINVGSTFTVTLPSEIVYDIPDYLLETNSRFGDDTSIPLLKENGKPIKILVVEDVELNAEILLEILDMEGFETAHAQNGKEAIEIFEQSEIGEFDIILMDMQMPIMDGCTAASKIRKLDRPDSASILIYACTANTFQEDRDLAVESGMNDFLTKPIDIDMLLRKIGKTSK